jgi:hypothetical protein
MKHHLFELHRSASLAYLEVTFAKCGGLIGRKNFDVLLADNLFLSEPESLSVFFIYEQVAPFYILEKYQVWTMRQNRAELLFDIAECSLRSLAIGDVLSYGQQTFFSLKFQQFDGYLKNRYLPGPGAKVDFLIPHESPIFYFRYECIQLARISPKSGIQRRAPEKFVPGESSLLLEALIDIQEYAFL